MNEGEEGEASEGGVWGDMVWCECVGGVARGRDADMVDKTERRDVPENVRLR